MADPWEGIEQEARNHVGHDKCDPPCEEVQSLMEVLRRAIEYGRERVVTHRIGCPALIGELDRCGYGTGRTLLSPEACTCSKEE